MSIEAIKEALKAGPTEGPWEIQPQGGSESIFEVMVDGYYVATTHDGVKSQCNAEENAAFIAACNPTAIRALIERLEAAEKKDQSGIQVGDYFTHKRTGARFVCRSVTRHDHDGAFQSLRVELDPDPDPESGGLAEGVSDA
jgi:hypothetical protein